MRRAALAAMSKLDRCVEWLALIRDVAQLAGPPDLRLPISSVSAGTSSERTMNVSSSTPSATTMPIWVSVTSGSTPSTENVRRQHDAGAGDHAARWWRGPRSVP